VQRALDETALQPAVGERGILVGTGVVDGVQLTVLGVEDGDGRCRLDADGLALGEVFEAADGYHGPPSRSGTRGPDLLVQAVRECGERGTFRRERTVVGPGRRVPVVRPGGAASSSEIRTLR
jgi:hypothetical protein